MEPAKYSVGLPRRSLVPRNSLFKIDAEGAEALVLAGGEKVLSEVRPVFYCEVGDETNETVTGIFNDRNYELVDPGNPKKKLTKCKFNTLALPREKAKDILNEYIKSTSS